ncbi:carbohydrate-binding protein [Tautonia rosea]|uniref:hypothetical protein n=1 Tax=Tautonia rosea TaxID=2728037 RepID=UPI0014745979|nr:hypothetical protein [Tautonia rosea]
MPNLPRCVLAILIMTLGVIPTVHADEPFRPEADRHGIFDLPADRAILLGDRLRVTGKPAHVVDWVSKTEQVRWDFELNTPGQFVVVVEYAAPAGRGGAVVQVVSNDQIREAPVHATGGPTRFFPQPMKGAIQFPSGQNRLEVRAVEVPGGLVMNLRRVRLVPANK